MCPSQDYNVISIISLGLILYRLNWIDPVECELPYVEALYGNGYIRGRVFLCTYGTYVYMCK